MKKIGIISTYPKNGSKNIGDYLISRSTEEAIRSILPDCEITSFFRKEKWENIGKTVIEQDHLIFACLAIRERDMAKNVYPYIQEIIDSKIPFTIIASGTQLPVHKKRMGKIDKFSAKNRDLLANLSEQCRGFSTRGCVSQSFCQSLGLKTENLGDIAFFDERFNKRRFEIAQPIRKIAISDPHYWRAFIPEFKELYFGLQKRFPDAEIMITQHGKSGLENLLIKENFNINPIYQEPEEGLEVYDDVDLHVGFRVHAHVATLKRRKYSYLIEQDGRGCDYGRNMNANISVPCFVSSFDQIWSKLFASKSLSNPEPSRRISAVEQLLSMIDKDVENGFSVFSGLEGQIEAISQKNIDFLKRNLL